MTGACPGRIRRFVMGLPESGAIVITHATLLRHVEEKIAELRGPAVLQRMVVTSCTTMHDLDRLLGLELPVMLGPAYVARAIADLDPEVAYHLAVLVERNNHRYRVNGAKA